MHFPKLITVGAMIGLATAGNGHSPTTFAISLVVRGNMPPVVTKTPEGATEPLPPQYSDVPVNPYPPEDNARALIIGSLDNARSRNWAKLCKNVNPDTFVEKTKKFLSYWKKEDAARNAPESEKEILERLIAYQVVQTTMVTVKEENKEVFPDDLLDYVRSISDLSRDDGVLTGANPRVLRTLDVIFDDVCATRAKCIYPTVSKRLSM